MTRIITHTVMKNEMDRYLPYFLQHVSSFADVAHFYDDNSTDDSYELIANSPCVTKEGCALEIGIRGENVPSFLEHESRFRQAAWVDMVDRVKPENGDFVICLDADEFLVSFGDIREELNTTTGQALVLTIVEVFGWNRGIPLVRVDGYWAKIFGCRGVRYKDSCCNEGNNFRDVRWAGGSVPATYTDLERVHSPLILHLGYAKKEDQQEKYDRYHNRFGGHSTKHIESILEEPELEPWTGPTPDWWVVSD